MNELSLLESELKLNNRKTDLILKDINERINRLEDMTTQLTFRVNQLLDELKPINTNTHGNWKDNEWYIGDYNVTVVVRWKQYVN